MSDKGKKFVLLVAAFGLAQLAVSAFNLHPSDPRRFGTYLLMGILASAFQARPAGLAMAFSLNLPFILLSIVELSLPETLMIGCAAAMTQSILDPQSRRRPLQALLPVVVLATIVATSDFTYHSILPATLQSANVRLLLASGAFFVANTLPAAIALRFSKKDRLGKIWKESYFWSFPYYLIAAATAGIVHAAENAASRDVAILGVPVLYVAYRYYKSQKFQLAEQQKHAGQMAALHLRAIEGLALAVEAKDNLNTRGHLRRVQVYALELGKELGLNQDELEALHAAALLHDIGKLAVPEHILTKPGKLTAEEFAKMKVHPVVGAEIVEQVQFPYPVAPIVRAHHEKWDGSGYPDGLKGEEIPIGARIITAVDCLDALSSDREYRRGVSMEDALKQIRAESGTSFDPRVVQALERRHADLECLAKAETASLPSLSSNAVIRKGLAPGAGLDLWSGRGGRDHQENRDPEDFLTSIAAARREGRLLLEISKNVGSTLDLDQTLDAVELSLKEMIPHQALVVFLRRANMMVAQYATGANSHILGYLEVPVGSGLTGWVAEHNTPVVNGNPAVDPGFACDPASPLRCALAVPPEGSNGLLGVIVMYEADADQFTHDHLRMLLAVTPKIGLAVQNALKFQDTEQRLNTDPVTGLPNSQQLLYFMDTEVARARRMKQPLSIIFLDTDGAREAYRGQATRELDQYLSNVAQGIRQDARHYDHVGCTGVGEFCVVMPGTRPDALGLKIARLGKIIGHSGGNALQELHFQIGQACYPDDGEGARQLMALAKRRAVRFDSSTVHSMESLQTSLSTPPVSESVPSSR